MLSAATAPESAGARVEQVADSVWNIVSWPETDLAADLGWSAGWTVMMFGMLKVLSVGLSAEFKRTRDHR